MKTKTYKNYELIQKMLNEIDKDIFSIYTHQDKTVLNQPESFYFTFYNLRKRINDLKSDVGTFKNIVKGIKL